MQQTEGHRLHQPVRSLEQVEQTLQFQATILANVQESVIVTDLQGKIIYWNEGQSVSLAIALQKCLAT